MTSSSFATKKSFRSIFSSRWLGSGRDLTRNSLISAQPCKDKMNINRIVRWSLLDKWDRSIIRHRFIWATLFNEEKLKTIFQQNWIVFTSKDQFHRKSSNALLNNILRHMHFTKVAAMNWVSQTIISCPLPIPFRKAISKKEHHYQHWQTRGYSDN